RGGRDPVDGHGGAPGAVRRGGGGRDGPGLGGVAAQHVRQRQRVTPGQAPYLTRHGAPPVLPHGGEHAAVRVRPPRVLARPGQLLRQGGRRHVRVPHGALAEAGQDVGDGVQVERGGAGEVVVGAGGVRERQGG